MIDAFAGAKGIARASRRRGFHSWSFEIKDGPDGDLTNPAVLRRIRRAARRGQIACMIMGPPCSSFSQARNASGALRSKWFPRGLPERQSFSLLNQKRIRDGNATLDSAIALVDICNRHHIPLAYENPQTSIMWSDAALQKSLAAGRSVVCTVAHCAFGTRWRKNTTFAIGNVDGNDLFSLNTERYRCRGKHGFCSFQRGRHVQLGYPAAGGDPKMFASTSGAAEYPSRLCSVLVQCLTSHIDFVGAVTPKFKR